MQNGLKNNLLALLLTLIFFVGGSKWQVTIAATKVQISLITCAPDKEVYSLYGHTAIRCKDLSRDFDYVFNYGVFSFQQPNFILRFVLGKCDYMLQPIPWSYFEREYAAEGRKVVEQVLNLTDEEAQRIMVALINESQPENSTYRYDFFRNNCTTKVRDVVECNLHDQLVYPDMERAKGTTFRQMLHEFNYLEPWSSEGCDLLLGADVDTVLTQRATTFLPYYFMHYAEGATLRDSINNARPLVVETRTIVEGRELVVQPFFLFTPLQTFWALLAFFVLIALLEYGLHYQFWLIDLLLLSAQGVVSMLLLFLMFISAHPGVHQNWLVFLFHPFVFYGAFLTVRAAWKRKKTRWHVINLCLILSFIVFSVWMPQKFGNIVLPLTLILLTRPVSYLLYYRK